MKKLLLFILILVSLSSIAQRITDLPAATGTGVGGLIPIVQGGVTKRIFIDSLPKLDTSSIYVKINQNAAAIGTKQTNLQSGININTINGLSLLGASNIVISGASSKALYKDLTLVAGGVTPFNFDSSSTAKLTTSGIVNIDITGSVPTGATGILAVTQSATGNDTLKYNGTIINIAKQANKTSLVGFIKLATSFVFSVDTTNIGIAQTAGTDVDAAALFTAASTDNTYRTAVNNAIVGLKAIALAAGGTAWSKSVMINGRAGTNLTQQSFNWRNPTLYNYTYNGTFAWNANGTQFNGTTNYITTGITPSTAFTNTTSDIAIVNVVGTNPSPGGLIFGSLDNTAGINFYTTPGATAFGYAINTGRVDATSSSSIGRFITFFSNASTLNSYRNGALLNSAAFGVNPTFSTLQIFEGAANVNGTPTYFSTSRIDVTQIINSKITAAESQAIDAVWANYETALSR